MGVGVNVAVAVAVAVGVGVCVAVAVGVDVAVAVGVNVAVAVGVGFGQARVYLTPKPLLSAAVPQEKVVAGPLLLACTPVVSLVPPLGVTP